MKLADITKTLIRQAMAYMDKHCAQNVYNGILHARWRYGSWILSVNHNGKKYTPRDVLRVAWLLASGKTPKGGGGKFSERQIIEANEKFLLKGNLYSLANTEKFWTERGFSLQKNSLAVSDISGKLPPLTVENLQNGINAHCTYKNWCKNLLPGFYRDLAARREGGLTSEWWNGLVDDKYFGGWVMYRPFGKEKIRATGLRLIGDLSKEYAKITHGASGTKKPSMESREWEDVAGLFNVAMKIKPTKSNSAVFASKLCHFVLPSVFGIIDNAASRVFPSAENYRMCWKIEQKRWRDCGCREELKETLRCNIIKFSKGNPGSFAGYPWAVRITDLCSTVGKK